MGRQRRLPEREPWLQMQQLCLFPEQLRYEEIRPIVLYGQSPYDRAKETQTPVRTLYRRVERFEQLGMHSVLEVEPAEPQHRLPPKIRQLICDLKAEHPALRVNEIATICYTRTGRRPDAKTIKRILADTPLQPPKARRFPRYHDIPDPAHRRVAIIRLHIEGWNRKSIAAYLGTSRKTVHQTLRRWWDEGVGGLYDKSRAPKRRVRKMTLPIMARARRMQQNNRLLGAFRLRAALRQEGIIVSLRTCNRILALNRQLLKATQPPGETPPRTKKPMPFQADRPHQYWSIDIQYLDMHTLGGGNIYAITVLDNYSRAILASAVPAPKI